MNARELAEQIMAEAMAAHGPKPKSRKPEPKLCLVSEADPAPDLEAMRSTNRRREAKLLAAEHRELRNNWKRMLAYRKRHGRFPPACAAEEAQRRLEAEQLRRQQALDYHIEMKQFHEEAERRFRENDILGLWS